MALKILSFGDSIGVSVLHVISQTGIIQVFKKNGPLYFALATTANVHWSQYKQVQVCELSNVETLKAGFCSSSRMQRLTEVVYFRF